VDTGGNDEAFTVREALRSGYTRHEVDRILPKPFWGIRAEQESLSTEGRCRQFLCRLPEGAFYSHTTAALLWGVTLPPWHEHDMRLHVSVPAGHRAVDAKQIIGHEVALSPSEHTTVNGLPVSAPTRVWRELGQLLSLADLVAVGDELLRRNRPLCSLSALRTASYSRGYRGKRNVMAALLMLDGRAESRPESLMRVALHTAGLPRMIVNEDVRRTDGSFLARPDIRFADYPVVVEYDGDGHRTDSAQWRRDVARLGDLADAGLEVVRATADDLPDFRRLVARTRSRLRMHGWSRRVADF
jgi:hypothetical protein